MNVGSGLDPALIIVAVSGMLLVVAVVVVGTQLFASAGKANGHLAKAAAFNPQVPNASQGPRLGANVARPNEFAPAGDTPLADVAAPPDADAAGRIVAQLNEYYAANINQGNAIFWASLLSMSIGFAIIFVGVVTAGANSTTALVAGVAGVLSQFIAATFLVALRSTQQQSTTYAQTLVELREREVRAAAEAQAVTLGLRLLNQISNEGTSTLADQTRAAIAMALIAKQALPPGVPAPTVSTSSDGDDPTPFVRTHLPNRVESVRSNAIADVVVEKPRA